MTSRTCPECGQESAGGEPFPTMRKTERELDLWEDTFRFSFVLKLCFEFELHLNTGQVGDWGGKQQLDGQVHSAGEKSGLAR